MRWIAIPMLAGFMASPAAAQDLGQVGRLLGDQLLPKQDNNRERDAYERGRRDAERSQRDEPVTGHDRRDGYGQTDRHREPQRRSRDGDSSYGNDRRPAQRYGNERPDGQREYRPRREDPGFSR